MNERIGKFDINGDPIEVGHILRGKNNWTIVITDADTYELKYIGKRKASPEHKQPGPLRVLRTELYFEIIGHVDEKQPDQPIDAPATIADQRRNRFDDRKGTFDAK